MENINKYLDLTHEYRILVPLSEEAEEMLYRGEIYENGEIASCFKTKIFHEDTYGYLEDRLFDFINVKFDLIINMYEEEFLEHEQLEEAILLTEKLINSSDEKRFINLATEFVNLLKLAKENNTIVGFYF